MEQDSSLHGKMQSPRHPSHLLPNPDVESFLEDGRYSCPCCSYKHIVEYSFKTHINNHLTQAIQFKGNYVCKCNRPCRHVAHFHCLFCSQTVLRRNQCQLHLANCFLQPQQYPRHALEQGPQPQAREQGPAPQAQQQGPQAQQQGPQAQQHAPPLPQPQQQAPQPQPQQQGPQPQQQASPPQQYSPQPQQQASPPQQQASPPQQQASPPQQQASPPQQQGPQANHRQLHQQHRRRRVDTVTCSMCGLHLNRRNLRVHMQRKHVPVKEDITASHYLPAQCIDVNNSVFAVAKSFRTPCLPVHVRKRTWGAKQGGSCEVDICRLNSECAERSNLLAFECIHLSSLEYCPPEPSATVTLSGESLTMMLQQRWFDEDKKSLCVQRQAEAAEAGVPLSSLVTVCGPTLKRFVSVYEPHISAYSRLGRVMVAYDCKHSNLRCPCSKSRISCVHKCVARWHLFSAEPSLFSRTPSTEEIPTSPCSDAMEDDAAGDLAGCVYPPEGETLERVLEYLLKSKRIPSELPHDIVRACSFPEELLPGEAVCEECGTPLSEPVRITAKARILTVTDVFEGISTYRRNCHWCGMVYRYQEWSDGLHNFDDHILMSLHLCVYLRNTLQSHQSVGSAVEVLEATCGKRFPAQQRVLQAYLSFEALSEHKNTFSCVSCSHHPAVVVMDLHRKGVLSMPVSSIEESPPDHEGDFDREKLWRKISLEVVSRGLIPSNRSNPFAVPPSYHHGGPWMCPHTRASDTGHQPLHRDG